MRVRGVRGEPPPKTLKVCLNHLGGFRNDVSFVLVGLDIEAKAKLAREQLEAALAVRPTELEWILTRTDREDADDEARASATLRVVAKDPDAAVVGRRFSNAAVELAISSYPGFFMTRPPGDASAYGVYTPAFVDASEVTHVAVLHDGRRVAIAPSDETRQLEAPSTESLAPADATSEPTIRAPLGRIMGARSGDKGGTANIGVWARSDASFRWLERTLDVAMLEKLLPETAGLRVARHVLPKIRAMNFVVEGLLGEGVMSSTRFDPQGKALGEWLRSRLVDVPVALMRREA